MPKHLMIAVDWFGPDDLDEAEAAKSDYAHALYMCLGRRPYQRARTLRYIGIDNSVHTRLKEDHRKLQKSDYATPRKNRPHPDWPDLIDYPGYDLPARMVWFGGRQQYFLAPGYAKP